MRVRCQAAIDLLENTPRSLEYQFNRDGIKASTCFILVVLDYQEQNASVTMSRGRNWAGGYLLFVWHSRPRSHGSPKRLIIVSDVECDAGSVWIWCCVCL